MYCLRMALNSTLLRLRKGKSSDSDENGVAREEKPYGFVIRVFHDAENRKEFRAILKVLKNECREMAIQDIWKIIGFKRKHSKASKMS